MDDDARRALRSSGQAGDNRAVDVQLNALGHSGGVHVIEGIQQNVKPFQRLHFPLPVKARHERESYPSFATTYPGRVGRPRSKASDHGRLASQFGREIGPGCFCFYQKSINRTKHRDTGSTDG